MIPIDCLYPAIVAVYSLGSDVKKDGTPGHKVVFGSAIGEIKPDINGEVPAVYQVPCGKCYNCRKQQAFAWAVRIQMEQLCYKRDECCFLTLTYDDDHVPYELDHKHLQRFLHTLRTILNRQDGSKIRYFVAGEYGSKLGRPHFHMILFGYDFFKDGVFFERSKSGGFLYTHDFITRSWPHGIASFGEVTSASAMYVAQYTTKKLVDSSADLIGERKQPYIQMSRRPGIGQKYIIEHAKDIVDDGGLYLNGNFVRINRYMMKLLLSSGDLTLLDRAKIHTMTEETVRMNIDLWESLYSGYYMDYVREQAQNELAYKHAQKLSKGEVF